MRGRVCLRRGCLVELIEFRRRDRLWRTTGAEIFGIHVRSVRPQLHRAPSAPPALMTAVRLLIRHHLPEAFDGRPEVRRIHTGRSAAWALHRVGL